MTLDQVGLGSSQIELAFGRGRVSEVGRVRGECWERYGEKDGRVWIRGK